MSKPPQHELLGLDIPELTALAESHSQPPYRGKQIFEAVNRQRVSAVSMISTLPADFRQALQKQGYTIGLPTVLKRFLSADGTVRYLMGLSDGESVETVWMPDGDGGEAGDGTEAGNDVDDSAAPGASQPWRRATLCVSSQVGCAVNCQFCLTARLGVKRNLSPGEIVGQVLAVLNDQQVEIGRDRVNLVFMGMGEPFLNYDNFIKAVRLLVEGAGIPESRMTVSTAGIVPRIYDFAKEPVRPKLAISLNASNDALRTRVMPINHKWDLKALLEAAAKFPLRNREKLTFEYVLLAGVNDSLDQAGEVVALLRGVRAKVNLIALNPGPDIPFATPSPERVLAFQKRLVDAGIPTFVRRPRGRDIHAACGQLKGTEDLVTLGA
ncbi:MAG TPA: 23S rRNA (adenine(2503)-C(2))-methyltransferase RlmN [Terriglobales bacterium]|nr:23S rRNA (adenine(2503)-C(2))-methyltransferase RlmN [Terriglobales bacterium]